MLSLLCAYSPSIHTVITLMFLFFPRPIAGRVNFCPISIADSEGDDDYIMALATHEILHALVSKSWLQCSSNIYLYSEPRRGQENPFVVLYKTLNPTG